MHTFTKHEVARIQKAANKLSIGETATLKELLGGHWLPNVSPTIAGKSFRQAVGSYQFPMLKFHRKLGSNSALYIRI